MRVEWEGEALLIRPVATDEEALVFQTWIRSYRPLMKGVEHQAYHQGQRRRVERLWRLTSVAVTERAPEAPHAWVCGRFGVLHYVYVPFELRRRGLAKLLVRSVCGPDVDVSHRWPFESMPKGWRANEYRLEDS